MSGGVGTKGECPGAHAAASRLTQTGAGPAVSGRNLGAAARGPDVAASTGVASFGHVAVGLGVGRLAAPRGGPAGPTMLLFALLALLPDVDALGGILGRPFPPPFGHRGATHSLAFGLAASLALTALAAPRRDRLVFFLAALATAWSHPFLDMLTHGGRGVLLLWPLSADRYRWPWAPLPAAPIGLRLLSARGLSIVVREAILFSPALAVAFWPRRRSTAAPRGEPAT